MTPEQTFPPIQHFKEPTTNKLLRLWPGLIAAAILVLGRFVVPYLLPEAALHALLAAFVAVLAIALWWLLFSRARWCERIGAVALIIVAMIVTNRLVHESISGGAMGYLMYVLAMPFFALVLVGWAAFINKMSAVRPVSTWLRLGSLLIGVVLVCAGFMTIRTGGITSDFDNDLHFRWSKTPEELLLTRADEAAPAASNSAGNTGTEWPGFRGASRDGIVRGTKVNTNWSGSPPVELWRQPVGPAWSSFAVSGDRIYTQEQRGSDETVSCYDLKTGKVVWRHGDAARFYESNGGPGPRGTPTLHNGRAYSLGATGILNALDAATGKVIWSRNAASDTGSKRPWWGFSASPLIFDNTVIVATAGKLAAYDLATGEPRWQGPDEGGGYSSPHLATIGGAQQIVLLAEKAATGVSPGDGKKLWEFPLSSFPRIIQPGITSEGDILIQEGEGNGLRRITVSKNGDAWTAQERWFSENFNPYFNDFVVHEGYTYGFDGSSIACMDVKDGSLKWKGGRYGHGQLVLLGDQDVLLILAEDGELALVKATTDQFSELARVPAIKGKTWGHPVLVGDVLLVRNGEEMAAFKLPTT